MKGESIPVLGWPSEIPHNCKKKKKNYLYSVKEFCIILLQAKLAINWLPGINAFDYEVNAK